MSRKEAFGERDPAADDRLAVVHAAVTAFENAAWREFGPGLVQQEGPAQVTGATPNVEAATLAQMAAQEGVAAISTQNIVDMSGAQDVRTA